MGMLCLSKNVRIALMVSRSIGLLERCRFLGMSITSRILSGPCRAAAQHYSSMRCRSPVTGTEGGTEEIVRQGRQQPGKIVRYGVPRHVQIDVEVVMDEYGPASVQLPTTACAGETRASRG